MSYLMKCLEIFDAWFSAQPRWSRALIVAAVLSHAIVFATVVIFWLYVWLGIPAVGGVFAFLIIYQAAYKSMEGED